MGPGSDTPLLAMPALEGIRYNAQDGSLTILNQLLLPHEIVYEPVTTVEDAWKAIREMKVVHKFIHQLAISVCGARTYTPVFSL